MSSENTQNYCVDDIYHKSNSVHLDHNMNNIIQSTFLAERNVNAPDRGGPEQNNAHTT
jgi:hypothetical protein